jgi:hypothetical protein
MIVFSRNQIHIEFVVVVAIWIAVDYETFRQFGGAYK